MQWVALIAVTIAALDQLTKWLIVRSISPEETRVVITGFFSLVNWHNTGAAWGIFQRSNLTLTVISLLTILGLYLFRHSFPLNRPGPRVALGLIAGGIIGNLIDRIRVEAVTDFLSFSIAQYHWPAFNVADSSIFIGVTLYIIMSWRKGDTAESSHATVSS